MSANWLAAYNIMMDDEHHNHESGSSSPTPVRHHKPSRSQKILREVLWFVGLIMAVAILHNYIFQAFYVSGSSMEPDYHDGDYLIISKLPVTFHNLLSKNKDLPVQRGQVLVFKSPQNPKVFFIKRVIGLPGDRVVIKNGVIKIYNKTNPDGLVLQEDYIDSSQSTLGDIDEVVEEGKLFVLGDNRSLNGSYDSREWGQLPQDNVTGVASLKIMPVNQLGPIKEPAY